MSSYTLPRPRYRTSRVGVPAVPHDASWIQVHAMKFIGWTTTFLVLCLLVWLSAIAAAIWLRVLCTLLIAMVGVIAGLRIATRSTSSYIADLQRVNKVLCDQQHELEEANAILLKQISAESPVESASPSEGS